MAGETAVAVIAISSSSWNIVGLLLVAAGVLILFRHGMPYRVRTGGVSVLALNQTDADAIKLEKRYAVLGWIGVALILLSLPDRRESTLLVLEPHTGTNEPQGLSTFRHHLIQ
jgi:hypothetical protein